MRSIVLVALVALVACTQDSSSGLPRRAFRGPIAHPSSPLFVHYPEVDMRIVRVEPRTGKTQLVLYPDTWQPDVRAVRDFAVDERLLFALLSASNPADDAVLYLVDLEQGKLLKRLPLAAAPRVLAWGTGGRLLVGHFTPASGHPRLGRKESSNAGQTQRGQTQRGQTQRGQLSVVDSVHLRLLTRVVLRGSCISMTADDADVFLIERVQYRDSNGASFAAYALVQIDVNRGAVKRRLELPAGARQVVIGPTGLLYVTHASGVGLHATDGTVSVVDPHRWEIIDRLRMDMIVRRIVVLPDRMVFSMLSRSGEAWFGVILPDHSTRYDFRFGELVTGELAVIGSDAFVPLRGKNELLRVRMGERPQIDGTGWQPAVAYSDRPGLIRTLVHSPGSADAR